MARPAYTELVQGQQSGDAVINDNMAIVFDGPFPVYVKDTVANLLADHDPADFDHCLVITEDTGEVWKSDGTDWRIVGNAVQGHKNHNGARAYEVTDSHVFDLSAYAAWVGAFPAGSLERALSLRVTEAVTFSGGGTTFDVGDGSDADMFAGAVAAALGTTKTPADRTADPNGAAAKDVALTPDAGAFTDGEVRAFVYYRLVTAPTS